MEPRAGGRPRAKAPARASQRTTLRGRGRARTRAWSLLTAVARNDSRLLEPLASLRSAGRAHESDRQARSDQEQGCVVVASKHQLCGIGRRVGNDLDQVLVRVAPAAA